LPGSLPGVSVDFQVFLPIEKVDEEKRMVWGYASTPTKDLQGEIVTLDAIKAALPDYMQWANIREMHTSSAVGVTKEAHVDEKGLYIGAKIVDDDAWKKCKEQVYKGFSIGGSKLQKVGDTIKELRLTEISIVDRPANPDARIDVCKVAGVVPIVAPEQAGLAAMFDKMLDIFKGLTGKPAAELIKVTPEAAVTSETPALTDAELADLNRKLADVEFEKREFSTKERKHLAGTGAAMSDGSYPVVTVKDLENAVHAYGRSPDEATKKHIISRAKALNATHLLPADWPGSTKKESTVMDQEMQKRFAAASKAAIEKAKHHIGKAMECHGKACEAINALHKCMGKAAGDGESDKHIRAAASHLEKMSDHHDLAMHSLSKASAGWAGEGGESPKATEGGDVPAATASLITLHPQSRMTEGHVEGSDYQGAGDSPYSAAAMAAEITKQVTAAVAAATAPLQAKLAETEKDLAFQKGQMAVIERLPSGGPRPRLMTGSGSSAITVDDLYGKDPKAKANEAITKAYRAIDPDDPDTATQAIATILGTRAAHPRIFGKSFDDPDYQGSVGTK
jgi:hypothetical protein